MAKGIETLAGPVSENDIIMRENEAPVGAAALMNKQVRKNTPGFYKLPSQDKDMPGFMKAAQAGVEQDMAKGDTINNMAGALIRQGVDVQGMNQDQIIMLYEQMMGSTGDRDQFGITDATKILNSIAPEGEKLAYINPDEAGILAMLGGSGDMTPQGIPSFDKEEDENMGMGYGYSSPGSSSTSSSGSSNNYEDLYTTAFGSGTGYTGLGDTVSSDADEQQTVVDYYQDREEQGQGGMGSNLGQAYGQTVAAREGDIDFDTNTQTGQMLSDLSAQNYFKDILTSSDPKKALLESDRYKDIQGLMDDFTPLEGNIGLDDFNLLGILKGLKEGGLGKKKKDRLFRDDDKEEMTLEGFMDSLGKLDGGRDTFFNLVKRLDPMNFYKVTGMPQTSGSLQDLASNQMIDVKGMDRDSDEYKNALKFNRQIDEARQTLSKEKGQPKQGGGGGVAPPVTTPDTTPDPDDDAYKFNVGGTMPYKDDVYTGGQEMDVPVGRRFALDKTGQLQTSSPTPEDMMQYATTGAYSQLEPFSNYIKRRRKFLGEEEPEYFDEEGNIIYSGVA